MYRKEAIAALRDVLKKEDISAMIIPSNDPHFGEYIPEYYGCRSWLSGFHGSAGTLVISQKNAALWTDSRYFIQAAKDLDGSEIELMKMRMPGTPSIPDWLKSHLKAEDIVALDEDLFTYQEYEELLDELHPLTATLIEDPFDKIWSDRPPIQFNPILNMDETISGESIESKHKRICDTLNAPMDFVYIISELDEIAWLFNIRGTDVEYNPLFLSYAIIMKDSLHLFIRKEMLEEAAIKSLSTSEVILHDYEEFTPYLTKLPKNIIRIFSRNKITAKNYLAALENIHETGPFPSVLPDPTDGGTISWFKAIKNPIELNGFYQAYWEDAKAWRKLLIYLEENRDKGINEYQVGQKLIEFRKECPDYLGESFQPIVAYQENAALPHYAAKDEKSATVLKPKGIVLIDSGAHYTYGTTDTTRTIPLGEMSQEQKDDYTIALKGTIDLAKFHFVPGLRGCLLDIIARGPIMNAGRMYYHGTCHGIGHRLCVHEGPQSIRMEENSVKLHNYMVMSDEPALYVEGKWGIRHENTFIIEPWTTTARGQFCRFKTITKVPIDERPINFNLLDEDEKKWLKKFNTRDVNRKF
ncbi:MAG: M24 family metallopeptidase [Bacteroidales bacterium]